MPINIPKDVPLTKIEKAHLIRNGQVIFEAFDLLLESDSGTDEFGRNYTECVITLKGREVLSSGSPPTQSLVDNHAQCRVEIQIRRTDVVEILKFGQFIIMKGAVIIQHIEYRDMTYTELQLVVNGNLDIR